MSISDSPAAAVAADRDLRAAAGFDGPDFPVDPPAGRFALGAFDPGRRGVRALIVLGVLVVLVAGFLAWRAQPRADPVAPVTPVTAAAPPAGPAAQLAGPGSLPAGSPGTIVVAIQGRVRHPGLVDLPAGSRVADAIDKAGGALPGVDLSFVNLARPLTDGELIVIGMTPPPGALDPPGASAAGAPAGKINLNTANVTQLDTLPGIGPALAQRIIDYRGQHGVFRSVDDLRQVSGIGDAKFAEIKGLVTV